MQAYIYGSWVAARTAGYKKDGTHAVHVGVPPGPKHRSAGHMRYAHGRLLTMATPRLRRKPTAAVVHRPVTNNGDGRGRDLALR